MAGIDHSQNPGGGGRGVGGPEGGQVGPGGGQEGAIGGPEGQGFQANHLLTLHTQNKYSTQICFLAGATTF